MMDLGIVSVRYAKALLRFAQDNKEAKQVYEETRRIAQVCLKVEEFSVVLCSPVIPDEQKIRLLQTAATDGNTTMSRSLSRFIELVAHNKRMDLITFIVHSYGTLYRQTEGIVDGTLIVPAPMSDEIVNKLRAMMEQHSKRKIDLHVIQDAAIEGGFIVQYDTYRLDASVRSRLQRYHRDLTAI